MAGIQARESLKTLCFTSLSSLKDGEHLLHPLVGVPEADGWDPGTGVAENPLFHLPEQPDPLLGALLEGRDENEEGEKLMKLIVCQPAGEGAPPNTSLNGLLHRRSFCQFNTLGKFLQASRRHHPTMRYD